jgi:DNA-binding MarR family transcriptional regulator
MAILTGMSTKLQAPRKTTKAESLTIGRALYGLMTTAVRSQPRDMSLTSLSTLATLELTGPRRITDLAASEGVMQPSMTALVSTLERSGLVERRRDTSDRRVALVALTSEGTEYIRARRRIGVEVFAQLIDALPTDEAESLLAAISAISHIQRLDEERRNQPNMVPSSAGRTPT